MLLIRLIPQGLIDRLLNIHRFDVVESYLIMFSSGILRIKLIILTLETHRPSHTSLYTPLCIQNGRHESLCKFQKEYVEDHKIWGYKNVFPLGLTFRESVISTSQ